MDEELKTIGKRITALVKDFTAIDVETTGFSPASDKIIELGAVRYRDGKAVDSFKSYVNPEKRITKKITDVTGITNEDVADAPIIDDILSDYLDFVGNDVVLGHNVHFDMNFINNACFKAYGTTFDNDFVDTLWIAKKVLKLDNNKLCTIADHYGITYDAHRAATDAEATAQCYYSLMADAINKGIVLKDTTQRKSYTAKPVTVEQAKPAFSTNSNSNGIGFFVLTVLLGWLGIHRFYAKKTASGVIWLFTLGICGIGWIIDIVLVLLGKFTDKRGKTYPAPFKKS